MIIDGVMLPPVSLGEPFSDSELMGELGSISQMMKYTAIIREGEKYSDYWNYILLVSGSPLSFIPKDASGYDYDCLEVWPRFVGLGQSVAFVYQSEPGISAIDGSWAYLGTEKTIPLGVFEDSTTSTDSAGNTVTETTIIPMTLVWANHDICYADYTVTTDDEGTTTTHGFITRNVYFSKTGVLPPASAVTVPYTTMTGIANGIRHVCDNSDELMISTMATALTELTPASDIVDGSLTSYNGLSTYTVRDGVFENCTALTTVTLPVATTVGERAFAGCTKMTTMTANGAVAIGANAFEGCTALTSVTMPSGKSIATQAFNGCTALSTVTLAGSTMCTLENADAFTGTPIAALTGSIKVNSNLVATYKADSVWSAFASIIVSSS